MLNWAGDLLDLPRHVKEIHFVVLLAYLIWQAARPCFDLVKLVLLFIVTSFTNIDLLVRRQIPWASPAVASEEHHKATINDLINAMVSILAGFHHLVRVKMLLEVVNGLFRAIIPACIDPLFILGILPCPIDLRHNGLGHIIWVLNVNPVSNLPKLASM